MESPGVKGILLGITLIIAGIATALIIPQLIVSLEMLVGSAQLPILMTIGPLIGIALTIAGVAIAYRHYHR